MSKLPPSGKPNDNLCPKHGDKYVIKKGTNRCPVGRKKNENCR